jgi:hypothetical protein
MVWCIKSKHIIIPIESGREEYFEEDLIWEFLIASGNIHNRLFTILVIRIRIDFTRVTIIATLSESLEAPNIELTFHELFALAITLLPDINSLEQFEVTELVKCLVNLVILVVIIP